MATALLVRHAAHDQLRRRLVGRMPGVALSPAGCEQAARLARFLAGSGADLVQSSPRERAQQTAQPIAVALHRPCTTVDALDEIDFGKWTGRDFEELRGDPRWTDWNRARSRACPPGGESMAAAQSRMAAHLASLRDAPPERLVVMVSHGDVIKSAVLHVLGLSLNAHDRFEISPASVSTVAIGEWGAKLIALNESPVG